MRWLLPVLGLSLTACDPPPTTTPTAVPEPHTAEPTPRATSRPAEPPSTQATLPEKPASSSPEAIAKLADGQNDFGFELFRTVAATGNFAFSPASTALALGMTYMGARGETAGEMRRVLRLEHEQSDLEKSYAAVLLAWQSPANEQLEIRVANRIFPERTLAVDERFQAVTRRGFGAPLEQLDYRSSPEDARQYINRWVKEQTKERIVDLLPPRSIDKDTRMVLVNALYFKAPWADPFAESATAPASFWVDGSREAMVPTMRRTDSLLHAKLDGVGIVEIPFDGERFALDIILPDAKNGLAAAERILSTATWKRWTKALSRKRVALSLPKFRVEAAESTRLGEQLDKMGVKLAFVREKADFTGIANPPDPADRLFIGEVFHKAFVEVNEKGAEAAAATAVVMPRAGSAPPAEEPLAFSVDRPFLFVIRDTESGMVMFLGRVTEPKTPSSP
jgi:serpin B